MSELLNTLGIDWKLLIGQATTFLVLLVILRLTVYKPLLQVMQQRRERIEHGLKGAEEADRRLAEIDEVRDTKLKEADEKALKVVGDAELSAKDRFHEIVKGAEDKADHLLKEAAAVSKQREEQQRDELFKEAQGLIRDAIGKTVELDPSKVDEQLISQAVDHVKGRA